MEIPGEELEIFLSMGYKKEHLTYAYQHSEDKSVESVLEWLIDHQHELRKNAGAKVQHDSKKLQSKQKQEKPKIVASQKKKKQPVGSESSESSWIGSDDDEEEKIQAAISSNKGKNAKKGLDKKEKISVSDPKVTIWETANEMSSKIANIASNLEPNILTVAILQNFTKWKNSSDDSVQEVLKHLKQEELEHKSLQKIRNCAYQSIDKLMTMKIKKESAFNMKNFEKLLLLLSKLAVFDPNQSEKLLAAYPKFADKMGFECNEEIIYYLDQCATDFEFRELPQSKPIIAQLPDRRTGKEGSQGKSKKHLKSTNNAVGSLPNVNEYKNSKFREAIEIAVQGSKSKEAPITKQKAVPKTAKIFSAAHINLFGGIPVDEENIEEYNESKFKEVLEISLKESKGMKQGPEPIYSEKDLCIVCMDKMREIVNLPCAHFVFCVSCGPLFEHCPMCTKPIIEHLRIYWS